MTESMFLEELYDVVFEFDENYKYVNLFTADDKYLFKKRHEYLNRSIYDVLCPQLADLLVATLKKSLVSSEKVVIEYPSPLVEDDRWFSGRIKCVKNNLGTIRFFLVISDITKQKHAELELKAKTDDLERFFAVVPELLCICDTAGSFIKVNKAWQTLTGYNEEDIKNRKIQEFVHPDDMKSTLSDLQKVAKTAGIANFENRVICQDGTYKFISWNCSRPSENTIYAAGRDITENKLTVEKMARLERLNVVGEMAASLGHEVRNPMTTVRGFLQHMYGKKELIAYKDTLLLMIDEIDRANTIITQFLSLAKDKVMDFKVRSLNKLVEEIFPLIKADGLLNCCNIEMMLGEIPDIKIDKKSIHQLLVNMVRNAIEAMPCGGKIIIRTEFYEGKVLLAITDEGIGIPDDVLDKIGLPFVTTKESGSGLGLAICYRIAQRHDAVISIHSIQGSGSVFTVSFPVEGWLLE